MLTAVPHVGGEPLVDVGHCASFRSVPPYGNTPRPRPRVDRKSLIFP
jgi:hypothetical protein